MTYLIKRFSKENKIVNPKAPDRKKSNWKNLSGDRWEGSGNCTIVHEESPSFIKEYNSHLKVLRDRVRSALSDIDNGFIYDSRFLGNSNDFTHEVDKFSNKSKGFLAYSKDIDYSNRLCYYIYKPANGVIRIVILSCKGHKFGKESRYYSSTEE